jgi:hypothetical protein
MTDLRFAGRPVCETAAEAAEQLARLLEQIGDALVVSDSTALLTIDTELQRVLAAAGSVSRAGDRKKGIAAVERAGRALARCQRLGSSFSEVARGLAGVAGAARWYDRAGGYIDRTARSSWLVRL